MAEGEFEAEEEIVSADETEIEEEQASYFEGIFGTSRRRH